MLGKRKRKVDIVEKNYMKPTFIKLQLWENYNFES